MRGAPAALLAVLLGGSAPVPRVVDVLPPPAYAWTAHRAVAHALGVIDGRIQTQSAEAFAASYAAGFRLFECDLILAADGPVVARHDWTARRAAHLGQQGPARPWTVAELRARPAHGRFRQLAVDDVMALLARHPGSWLITDTKALDAPTATATFRGIVAAAKAHGVLDRVVPQLYDPAQLPVVRAVHPFRSWILTLYQTSASDDEVLAFCRREGIHAVTMGTWRATPGFLGRLAAAGVVPYLHTVNRRHQVEFWQRRGAWGFYTDVLDPSDVGVPAPGATRRLSTTAGF